MRILGLDIGDKTIGVAVSDELGIAAHGVTTIRRQSFEKDIRAVKEYVKEYEPSEIVAGLPRNMDGSYGPQSEKVMVFVEKLRKAVDIPVELYDERLTTSLAERALIEVDMSRAKRRKVIDKVAAQVILQGYMAWKTRG